MKKIKIAALAMALFTTACTKEQPPEPEKPQQVKYTVECENCIADINGQPFQVKGLLRYTTPGNSGTLTVTVTGEAQAVKASIITDGRIAAFGKFLGGKFDIQKSIEL